MAYIFLILIFYSCLFSLSIQKVINNPIKTNKESNPIDYIIIFLPDKITKKSDNKLSVIDIKKDFPKLFINSYIFTQSVILCIDHSNNYFLLIKEKYYEVHLKNDDMEIKGLSLIKTLDKDVKYLGYIKQYAFQSSFQNFFDEIIIYGKLKQNLIFIFMNQMKKYVINLGDSDDQISCKLIYTFFYVCAFSSNHEVKIITLSFTYSFGKDLNLEITYSKVINRLSNHENIILYDTSDSEFKILCAKKIGINNVECIAIYIEKSSISFMNISLSSTIITPSL